MNIGVRCLVISSLLLFGCSDEITGGAHIVHQESLIDSRARICIIGDSGTGEADQFAVAAALESAGCTQVRVLGDIIYPAGLRSKDDPLLQSNFYKPYRDLLDSTPFYLIQGNHDHMSKTPGVWLGLARQNGHIVYPANYYSERWRDICFISLDSSFYEKLYFFHRRGPQTSWLRKTLKQAGNREDCKFSVVFSHHPYLSSGHHGDAPVLLSSFLKEEVIGKVDLYVAGHDHILADEGYARGTRLLISGSAGKNSSAGGNTTERGFMAGKCGFILLSFERNNDNSIAANFEIRSVDVESEAVTTKLEWKSSTLGRGLRL